jgi:VWFA-related protein
MRPRRPISLARIGVASLLLFVVFLPTGIFSGMRAAAGQSSGEQEIATQDVQSTFKVQVQRNMVLVRVIVRDSNGRPVPGLKKENFRLFDNGKPQEIDQFAFESSEAASANGRKTTEKEEGEEGTSGAGAANSTPRNYQALYFDDLQMKFEDIAYARDSAERYLAGTLTPASRVGIFTASGQGNLDFTEDRSQLHEALFKLRYRPAVLLDTQSCPDLGDYQAYLIAERNDPDATAIATNEAYQCNCENLPTQQAQQTCLSQMTGTVQGDAIRVMNAWETQSTAVLRGLEQVVRRTALLPGQHSVIFVSPGFLLYNLEAQVDEIADRALRSNVVISTLDPRGLYVIIPGGDSSRNIVVLPQDAALAGRKQQLILDEFSHDEEVLNNLASDTGGQFFHNSNDLDKGFRLIGTLSDVSYVLAFSPRNLKFDGRFHQLKVSLVSPVNFTIQARRGYFAPKASLDAAARAKEEVEQAVFSQDELKELPIDVHTQFFKVNESDARLAVLTHLDLSSVRFRKEQDRNRNDLTFVTVLFDRDGKYVIGKEKHLEFRLRDASLAKLAQTGITLKTEFDVKPGTYLVRQIVRDSEAGQLSGLNRTVEIPY